MSFAHPHLLWFLLVVPPAMVLFFWWARKERQRLMRQFIQARLLPGLVAGVSPERQKARATALVAAVALLIIALARPQWGYELQEVQQRGLDIVVAIDTSKSMLAEDLAPNRLARAKLATLDLMRQARTDRLGLVAFAGSAFVQCPLTIDDAAFRQSLDLLDVNLLPQGGSALAEAIDTALTAFKEGDNYKVLVLFSDGEDHESGALEAAERAAKAGLRIFTIGVGTAEGELLKVPKANGQVDYIRNEQGQVVKSRLNEPLLQQIAGAASGFYLPIRSANAIDTLYQKGLAPLPKSESQEKWVRRARERYHWPVALAVLLLLLEFLFPERQQPRERKKSARRTSTESKAAAVAALVALLLPAATHGSAGSALREYRSGKYEEALQQYERLLERKDEDHRLHFNAGAAAYQSKRYDAALKHFDAALPAPDLKLQELAYYNRANTFYQLGQARNDFKQKSTDWEKAIKDYESALKLDPEDADAKFNLEFVKRKLEELKQQQQQQQQNKPQQKPPPSEAAKKAKAEADEAVRRREYARALQIMENHLKVDPTTEHYSDYIQRLREVNGVQSPDNP